MPHLLFADDLVLNVDCDDYDKGLIEINCKANDYRSKTCIPDSIVLDNDKLEVVQCFKYLGVNIDSTLSFAKHYDVVNGRINAAISKMYTVRRFFTENTIKIFMSCYVVSTIDYCFEIWGCQNEGRLEKLQLKINRFLQSFFYPGLYKKEKRGENLKKCNK